ncbi:MAG: type VI secretion system baseplate subunit TssG [Gammaproteobacteria bacterium]|nr:type VI secretion system baseplate subunit TssG [Gammaproteobacteria bacterium]
MATESRRTDHSLADALQQEPWRFEFFQAVRLIEALARRAGTPRRPAVAVGYSSSPAQDLVRFHATLARGFPSAEISRLTLTGDAAAPRADMHVSFMGLTGPNGVLPEHYLDLLLRQARQRDHSLRDFFDLFNQRTLALFYRAWEKYRPLVAYERARRDGGNDDALTRVLLSLVGLGTPGQSDRLPVDEGILLAYAGQFSHLPRSAWSLQALLANAFGVNVAIQQFVGRWLVLDEDQRSRLPGGAVPAGQYNRLGIDTVLGAQAWDEQGKFSIRIGPLRYRQFCRLLPDAGAQQNRLRALFGLVRQYVGAESAFDVRLLLAGGEKPRLLLGRQADGSGPRLGWNTWLGVAPTDEPQAETVFRASHVGLGEV